MVKKPWGETSLRWEGQFSSDTLQLQSVASEQKSLRGFDLVRLEDQQHHLKPANQRFYPAITEF